MRRRPPLQGIIRRSSLQVEEALGPVTIMSVPAVSLEDLSRKVLREQVWGKSKGVSNDSDLCKQLEVWLPLRAHMQSPPDSSL